MNKYKIVQSGCIKGNTPGLAICLVLEEGNKIPIFRSSTSFDVNDIEKEEVAREECRKFLKDKENEGRPKSVT